MESLNFHQSQKKKVYTYIQNRMKFANSNNEIRKRIQDYSYALNDLIGKGFSSTVFKGINQHTGEQVSIKVIDLKAVRERSAKQLLEGEIETLRQLNHVNILRCLDIYNTHNNCYIITQFCNEGDLEHLLKKREKFEETEAIPIFKDIINGFKAIVDGGFLHRDLKPANIFMKDKIAKIGDFGFAKRVSSNPKEITNVGSPLYMSPESLKNNIYTVKSDIWSIGIILYQMLHGKVPWKAVTEEQLLDKYNKETFSLLSALTDDLKDFIRKCLMVDENRRMNFIQMMNHPFIIRLTVGNMYYPNPYIEKLSPKKMPTTKDQPSSILQKTQSQNQKQILCQLNYVRFMHRLQGMISNTANGEKQLKFFILKQMLSVLNSLRLCLAGENLFGFEGWHEFMNDSEKHEKYLTMVKKYLVKYSPEQLEYQTLMDQFQHYKPLKPFADTNLRRSQFHSIMSISYCIMSCNSILSILKTKNIHTFSEQDSELALQLDYLITFYQLNCLLVDNFYDMDYFGRMSKIDLIMEAKPLKLHFEHVRELQGKMLGLDIIN